MPFASMQDTHSFDGHSFMIVFSSNILIYAFEIALSSET